MDHNNSLVFVIEVMKMLVLAVVATNTEVHVWMYNNY